MSSSLLSLFFFFFFNDTATTEIYTLSLHDALPICSLPPSPRTRTCSADRGHTPCSSKRRRPACSACWRLRSEEHTSELQSQFHLVCRLLLEKKKKPNNTTTVYVLQIPTHDSLL